MSSLPAPLPTIVYTFLPHTPANTSSCPPPGPHMPLTSSSPIFTLLAPTSPTLLLSFFVSLSLPFSLLLCSVWSESLSHFIFFHLFHHSFFLSPSSCIFYPNLSPTSSASSPHSRLTLPCTGRASRSQLTLNHHSHTRLSWL